MQVQLDIAFEQLVEIAKSLPPQQWAKLKSEVEQEAETNENSTIEDFLLTAPTFTKKQLTEINKTRKAITQWRTK